MKESMRKPVLFFMDLMVVFLAVILTIELIAIAGFTFPFMETGHRTSAFLRRIQDQEYQKCVEYYYENEANGVEPDEELKECYGLAKYYEAAWQRMRYLASGEQVLAKEAEAGMEAAAEEMGELQPVRERIDEILKQGR